MSKKCLIIFSGFNQRAVISFIRTLESNKVEYAIIAKSKDDTILLSSYKIRVIAIRNSVPLVLSDIIKSIRVVKKKVVASEYIIAPSSEALNRFLIANRQQIEFEGVIIPLVPELNYNLISNKQSFGQLCEENGILTPKGYLNIDDALIPFVAKPKTYFASDGRIHKPVLILSNEIKEEFINKYNLNDFSFQDYIQGRSYYLLYYFHRNGKIIRFSQENIAQQHQGKSMVAALPSDFHLSDESLKYEKLFNTINFFGLVMVEVKQVEEQNYMIEANPRFWGPSQLFIDAGVNLFEAFLHDYGAIDKAPTYQNPKYTIRYFWFGGVISVLKQKQAIQFYPYSSNMFFEQLDEWLQFDVYKRKDTISIFLNELSES